VPRYGELGVAGFYAAFIGVALMLVNTVATILVGREVLDWLIVLGFLGTSVGLVLVGAATLRAEVLPRWYGVLLIVAVLDISVYFALGDYGGAILYGLLWLALGYVLWIRKEAAREHSLVLPELPRSP
jgi:hypothetical protein